MNEYISFNEMISLKDQSNDSRYFLLLQCVIKTTSTITRVIVIFDALIKTSSGLSVNVIIFVRPTMQDDLLNHLRFRTHSVVLT